MEKNTMIIIGIVALIAVAGGIAAYVLTDNNDNGAETDDGGDTTPDKVESKFIHCQDMSDNWIDMPKDLQSMYTCGAGTLRTISHLGLAEKVCASDQLQKGATRGSNTFMYAFDEHFNQQTVKDCSDARMKVNLEKILVSNNGDKPQVLVIMDSVADSNASTIESLKNAGIVVFEMNYSGSLIGENGLLDPLYEKQISRMGVAFNCVDRANELLSGIKNIINDIRSLASGNSDAYIGGMTVQRTSGMGNTALRYPSFVLTDTNNITNGHDVATTSSYGQVNLSPEKVVDIINSSENFKVFVEPASWRNNQLVAGDTIVSAALANKGITEGMVLVPINSYGVDYDNVLVNGYLIAGHNNDLDKNMIREKIDSVYQLFYGAHAVSPDGVKLFDEMGAAYLERSNCTFGENVTFTTNGITMTNGTHLE